MGWIITTNPETGEQELLGDENQYRRFMGQEHRRGVRLVSEAEMELNDKMGE